MSIHPSLRGVDTLVGERSVFTRKERIESLMKDGKLSAEESPYRLPKVRTRFKLKKIKTAPEATAEAEDAEDESKDAGS